jgi:hypothetical protein
VPNPEASSCHKVSQVIYLLFLKTPYFHVEKPETLQNVMTKKPANFFIIWQALKFTPHFTNQRRKLSLIHSL